MIISPAAWCWIFLALAIVLEVCGTTSMKFSEGFTRLWPSILIFVFYGMAFTCLTLALKTIDISVAYAIWAGIGTALIATIGIVYFRESLNVTKAVSIALIIVGVIGLNLSSTAPPLK